MQLIDIGVNFHSKQLRDLTDSLIERAKAADVSAILATGTSIQSSHEALALAHRYPGYLSSTAGVHPHSADAWSAEMLDALGMLWQDDVCVAVGECGLDYNRNFSTPANQRLAFAAQLSAAVKVKKPLFLHCRDAFADFHAMVKEAVQAGAHGVVHCFTESADEARALVDIGLDIGITGWVTDEKRGGALRSAIPELPLDRLHLETDAPYLGPKNANKRRPYNEPANLIWVARAVAQLKGISEEDVAQACSGNSQRLFGLSLSSRPSN
ncbi:MAG: Deoxyribonuclease TatD [Caballeronia sp.]|jgi:TatD DNase family protein|uniref:TatD family hydrolase n=1 Tax=Caballeronia sp. TaxID=1931223 RepID=UPI002616A2E5|nr:TatD family hydrolase [Caballeronia sp.]MDB5835120.1 Deoxyribonuclease TatD [Caballeronia sp.]